MDLKQFVRDVPDFPIKGILFRDITPILGNADALRESVNEIISRLDGVDFDFVAGPESRGFLFGVPVSYAMNKGFIPVRKKGKLPHKCLKVEYELEYGIAAIEMHEDAIQKGQKVVIIDDLLATGGTSKALIDIIEKAGGQVVSLIFFIELEALGGRKLLEGYNVQSILNY